MDINFKFADGDRQEGEASECLIYPPANARALCWLAALSAQGIAYRVMHGESGWIIAVPINLADSALNEIRTYERINYDWPAAARGSTPEAAIRQEERGNALLTSMTIIIALIAWYLWTGPARENPDLISRAAASARAIRDGEVWRCISALTLHADAGHLLGNVISLLFFGYAACRRLGAGTAWLAILIAAIGANYANAWIVPETHSSIGASTAGFAALGFIAFHQFRDKYHESPNLRTIWHRAWVAIAAAIALLAILGTGPGTDISGHLMGFISGIAAGGLTVPMLKMRRKIVINSVLYGFFWILILSTLYYI